MNISRYLSLRIVLGASMAANVALLCWAAGRAPDPQMTEKAAIVLEPKTPSTLAPSARRALPAAFSARPVEDSFRWEALESSDYQTFIENLRRIGCPEETICDLIVADVNKSYAAKLAAAAKRASGGFWLSGQKRRQLNTEAESELNKLNAERREILTQLLGPNGDKQPTLDASSLLQEEAAYGFLSAEKRGLLRDLLQRHQEEEELLQRQSKGLLTTEDRAAWQALQTRRRDELAALLSPAELEDYHLRTSSAAQNVRSKLGGMDVSEQDFREMYRIRKSYEDAVAQLGEAASDGSEQRQLLRQKRDEQVRSYLGDQRYAQFQRSQDFEYQDLSGLASRHNLPGETVDKAYTINQAAREQRQQIMNDPSIAPERKQEALQAIKTATDIELENTLGKDAYQNYRQSDRVLFEESVGSGLRTIISTTVDGNGTVTRRSVINEPPSPGRPTRRELDITLTPR